MSTDTTEYMPPESLGTRDGRSRLTDRRILVIGGGQDSHDIEDPPIGNGRAMSVLFAREGAQVAVADCVLSAAKETCQQIAEDNRTAIAIEADITKPDDITRMFSGAADQLGGLDGIVYNIVAPGLIDTSLGRLATKGRPGRAKTPVPLGRQGTGWETANAALFLMSDEAAYITGQILSVDGGMSTIT